MCDCGRILYAPHGRDIVQCKASNCGASWNVDESQEILRAALDEKHVTAAEAAHLAGFLETDRTGCQIRKLVNKWNEREVLQPVDGIPGKINNEGSPRILPLFRFGDIANLLDRMRQRRHRSPAA
ncbi:hypothetical protein Are01nite_10750 [Actinoplanes regularis]|nr:hypothetical protein Are01nite_10750 [Actinoplanes regularis]